MSQTQPRKITDLFDLSGRNFLITGGARGIGLACAQAIAQLGAGIAVIDTLSTPSPEFAAISATYNVKTCYVQGDVTSQSSLESAFDVAVSQLGTLHGGLTSAGICKDEALLDLSWENCQNTLNVNVLGTLWTIKLLAKHMVERGVHGSIVTIASINAQGLYVPVQPQSSYNASKAAIKGMMGPLGGELGQCGIRINSISPGESVGGLWKMLMRDRSYRVAIVETIGGGETSCAGFLSRWESIKEARGARRFDAYGLLLVE